MRIFKKMKMTANFFCAMVINLIHLGFLFKYILDTEED